MKIKKFFIIKFLLVGVLLFNACKKKTNANLSKEMEDLKKKVEELEKKPLGKDGKDGKDGVTEKFVNTAITNAITTLNIGDYARTADMNTALGNYTATTGLNDVIRAKLVTEKVLVGNDTTQISTIANNNDPVTKAHVTQITTP